ncbi:HNH endonuclease [Kozakia baliensis]|uniref:HNH endonuclease n=1 Tax=Kozakia baliensis TaxID=153496 RepID=UPI001C9A24EF|nr:HNH endonuclease [Kozakia baliensis]
MTYTPHSPSSPRGMHEDEVRQLVQRFQSSPNNTFHEWRIASHKQAQIGDRVYLFKQGKGPRGIFGIGEIASLPKPGGNSNNANDANTYWASIKFNYLVDPAQNFVLGLEAIQGFVPASLIDARASGQSVPPPVADELERRLAGLVTPLEIIKSFDADDLSFDPDSAGDERERAMRAIRLRRGQAAFRASLLEAYGGRCVISNCTVKDVLEAAHIVPYNGPQTNHVSNGLLLRADLHTLFDCHLFSIDPRGRRITIADSLIGTGYEKISGKKIRIPNNENYSPHTRYLERRYNAFRELQNFSASS